MVARTKRTKARKKRRVKGVAGRSIIEGDMTVVRGADLFRAAQFV